MTDPINPPHYRSHKSGVECIEITEQLSFCLGNAVKYAWRASLKGNRDEDLRKCVWYLRREAERLARIRSWPRVSGITWRPVEAVFHAEGETPLREILKSICQHGTFSSAALTRAAERIESMLERGAP